MNGRQRCLRFESARAFACRRARRGMRLVRAADVGGSAALLVSRARALLSCGPLLARPRPSVPAPFLLALAFALPPCTPLSALICAQRNECPPRSPACLAASTCLTCRVVVQGGDPAPAADTAGASKSTPAAAQPLAIKIVQALLPLLLVVVALLIKLYADAPKTTADAPADAPVTANA